MEHPWLKAAEQWLADHQTKADAARKDMMATMEDSFSELRRRASHLLPRNDFNQPINAHPLASLPFAAIGTATSNIRALLEPENLLTREMARSSQAAVSSPLFSIAMSTEQVARRLDGLPVFTVSNSSNEFVLISDMEGQKSLGLFCFRKEDANTLLAQVKDRDPSLGRGARVVQVTLDKVYQLAAEGIAFRFLPDPTQVKHAIQLRAQAGDASKGFDGVPVFQSENLILRSKNRRFCPVFLKMEDLESALSKAKQAKKKTNPSMAAATNIQVGSLEDVLKKLEANDEDSSWADLLLIPAGMDAQQQMSKAVAEAHSSSSSSPPPTVIC